jgi:hypothetical protein
MRNDRVQAFRETELLIFDKECLIEVRTRHTKELRRNSDCRVGRLRGGIRVAYRKSPVAIEAV